MPREVNPLDVTLIFGGRRASTLKEQRMLSLLSPSPSSFESSPPLSPPLPVACIFEDFRLASSSREANHSSSESMLLLPLLLRREISPSPKSGAGAGPEHSGLAGEAGSQPDANCMSSVGAARSMFCFARFKRFIISSELSFLSGSVSLSGWNCNDFARQAFVISFTVAVGATPKMTWSCSSQMVFTCAGSVLKPFCLLSITWFSLKTRTHAT
mmetsp:Transcript_74498/g.216044  ORF Transcript_74498/g.216044 Transcript_74498/m.216044 type:complete len:213 (+) Transcript_74498:545-1183(+)